MGADDGSRWVHFQSPESLVDRIDAIAELFGTDRTDLIVKAIREYVDQTAENERFQQQVVTKYYSGDLEFEQVKQLAGDKKAQQLRLLKADLEGGPTDVAAPDDIDVYDGSVRTVDPKDVSNSSDAANETGGS